MHGARGPRSIFFSFILVISSIFWGSAGLAESVACRSFFPTREVAFSVQEWRERAEREVSFQRRDDVSNADRLASADAYFQRAWAAFRGLASRPVSHRQDIRTLVSEVLAPVAFQMIWSSPIPARSQGYALDQAWLIYLAELANPQYGEQASEFLMAVARGSRTGATDDQSARLADILALSDRDFLIASYARFGRIRVNVPNPLSSGAPVHRIDQSLAMAHSLGDPEVVFRLSILASRSLGTAAERANGYLAAIERAGVARP